MFWSLSFGGALQTSENWGIAEELVYLLSWLSMIVSSIAIVVGAVIHNKLVKRRQTIGEQGRMELLQDEVLVEKEKVRITHIVLQLCWLALYWGFPVFIVINILRKLRIVRNRIMKPNELVF